MVLHGNARHCMVQHGIAWYNIVLHGTAVLRDKSAFIIKIELRYFVTQSFGTKLTSTKSFH